MTGANLYLVSNAGKSITELRRELNEEVIEAIRESTERTDARLDALERDFHRRLDEVEGKMSGIRIMLERHKLSLSNS